MSKKLSVFEKSAAALSAAGLLAALSGCGVGSAASSTSEGARAASLHLGGTAKGGQQPLSNSTIQLWAAGTTTGYGQGATPLISASVKTGADGSFNITGDYTCPATTPAAQVYLTATGGNPTGDGTTATNNPNIQLVAALGSCNALVTNAAVPGYYLQVNEVTTAAAAFALGQFYGGFGTSTDSIGAPASNVNGLINAFATAHNLADVTTGLPASTTVPAAGSYMTGNDQNKLLLIADVIAACVNSVPATDATNCSTLFSNVAPHYAPLSTSALATPPVNTFQAAVYMGINPTSNSVVAGSTSNGPANIHNLYLLKNAQSAFATTAVEPTDWSLALQYITADTNFLSGVAIDSNGDIWASSALGGTTSTANPGGVVMLNGGTGTVGGVAGVTGGEIGYYSGPAAFSTTLAASGTRQLSIDLQNRAWFGTFNGTGTTTTYTSPGSNYYLFRAVGGSGVDGYFKTPSGNQPYSTAVDPNGEVFANSVSTPVYYTATSAATGTNLTSTALEAAAGVGIAITKGKVAYIPTATALSNFSTTNFVSGAIVGNTAITGVNYTVPYGTAIDMVGRVLIANQPTTGTSSISIYDPSLSTNPFSAITSGCLQRPNFIAVDGNNTYWVSNQVQTGGSGTNFGICQFDSAGNLLTESIGLNLHGISTGRGIAVDLSGNVWVTNYVSGTKNLTQIIGVATPAVNPISLAAKNGTIGMRP